VICRRKCQSLGVKTIVVDHRCQYTEIHGWSSIQISTFGYKPHKIFRVAQRFCEHSIIPTRRRVSFLFLGFRGWSSALAFGCKLYRMLQLQCLPKCWTKLNIQRGLYRKAKVLHYNKYQASSLLLRTGRLGDRGSIPSRGKGFFL
jgi:hypothetical protein